MAVGRGFPSHPTGLEDRRGKTDIQIDGLFSGQLGYAGTRKVNTILDFNEARDDGVAVPSAELYASHLHLASDR